MTEYKQAIINARLEENERHFALVDRCTTFESFGKKVGLELSRRIKQLKKKKNDI